MQHRDLHFRLGHGQCGVLHLGGREGGREGRGKEREVWRETGA